MKILIVLSSHDELGNTGRKTGTWYEELAAPYFVFHDAGHDVTLASPKGGGPPIDPVSANPPFDTSAGHRFDADEQAQSLFTKTAVLKDLSPSDFDTVFYPGGHGPLYDLFDDPSSMSLIETLYAAGKPIATVCHGAAVLLHVKDADGRPLVEGEHVTGFTVGEEAAMGLTDVVPFLVETELVKLGSKYSKVGDFEPYTVTDGLLITGQNPASAKGTAEALLQHLSVSH